MTGGGGNRERGGEEGEGRGGKGRGMEEREGEWREGEGQMTCISNAGALQMQLRGVAIDVSTEAVDLTRENAIK